MTTRVEAGAAESAREGTDADAEPTFREIFRDAYLIFDRRTLGFARFFVGFLFISDLFRRAMAWNDMYGLTGVLPNHLILWRPQANNYTFVSAFTTDTELWVLWVVMLLTGICLFVGYKTKVAQCLCLFFVTGLNGRNLLIENGGYVVNNLLFLWTCFLPLGDRFSVDALLRSMRTRRESTVEELNDRSDVIEPRRAAPHVTIMALILVVQLAAVYGFNVIHKKGPAWHNGTAVHYVLYVDRMVTPFVALVRDHIPNWMIFFMTNSTLAFEASLPFALLLPVFVPWARRAAIFMMNTLHIAFGTSMVLGPFAWSACVFSTLLFRREDWEIAFKTMRRTHRARVVVFRSGSGAAFWMCRLLKRLDGFELLTFREEEGVREGIVVEAPDGSIRRRAEAAADIVDALPLGPLVSWSLRLPGVRAVIDAALAKLEDGRASKLFGAKVPERSTFPAEPSPLRESRRFVVTGLRELLALIMFAAAVDQAANELWAIKDRWKVPQPEPMRILAHRLRFLQGWFMFSPNPVMDDGTIIVDAVTVDGRHIDPFTGKAPDFDIGDVQSYGYNQIWSDYLNRIHLPNNSGYRDAMRDYMLRLPERTGNPNDAIVRGDVYWVQDMNPPWNSTKSYKPEQQKLFSFEAPKR